MKFRTQIETLIGVGPEELIAVTYQDESLLRAVAMFDGSRDRAIGQD
jgi:hypothetical protein